MTNGKEMWERFCICWKGFGPLKLVVLPLLDPSGDKPPTLTSAGAKNKILNMKYKIVKH